MLKKSLLSLAVTASMVGLAGCNISSTTDNAGAKPVVQQGNDAAVAAQAVHPVFNPVNAKLPVGIDFIFAKAATSDGTADTGAEGGISENAVTNAIDDLDGGISTVANIDIPMSGSVDPATVVAGSTVHLIKLPSYADIAGANLILPDGVDATSVDALDLASLSPFFAQTKQDGTAPANSTETVAARNLLGSTFDATTDGIINMQPVAGTDYSVSVVSVDNGTDNLIRVNPLKPLDPKTKYIVLITGGVDDASGEAIAASSDYTFLKGTGDLFTTSLAGVRASIQGWEQMAGAILTTAVPTALNDGIALTAGFTTVDPHTVLKSMAYPGYWAPSVITNNTIADAVITAGGIDASGVADAAKIPTAIGVANAALTTANPNLGGAIAYENPRKRETATITNLSGAGINQVPGIGLSASLPATVTISQGAIKLPQYTALLTAESGQQWEANSVVGAVLDGALGQTAGTTPPKDVNEETNVTYRYPFAKEQRDAVVPILMIEPIVTANTAAAKAAAEAFASAAGRTLTQLQADYDSGCAKPGAGWSTIIFQHGITVDRAATLGMASQLAQSTCSAVIAIDLPHHGIAPVATDKDGDAVDNTRMAFTVNYDADIAATTPWAAANKVLADADANSLFASLAERHENLAANAQLAPTPMTNGTVDDGSAFGKSGDFFIRLDHFQRTRDNLRQAVMDLLNLNASVDDIDVNGDGTADDLNPADVHFVGHSLGAIVGATFVAVNNDATVLAGNTSLNQIQTATLATPGGGLPKLLENSVVFSQSLLPGLAANGLSQGDSNLESFFRVFQATVDTADPVNFIESLGTDGDAETPTFIIEMVGGGAVDAADYANLPEDIVTAAQGLSAPYPSDLVVPNNATTATTPVGADRVETAFNEIAGTDKLIQLLNSTTVSAAGAGQGGMYPVAKYVEGTHGTYSSADVVDAFTEMVTGTTTFITSDGAGITVADGNLLQ
ncbi:MAG: hypothetical protein HWE18_14770 [Gammaproteobacteria bacterium]|nr:hypothetical protein [Gammaproteobacteria bacterium]